MGGLEGISFFYVWSRSNPSQNEKLASSIWKIHPLQFNLRQQTRLNCSAKVLCFARILLRWWHGIYVEPTYPIVWCHQMHEWWKLFSYLHMPIFLKRMPSYISHPNLKDYSLKSQSFFLARIQYYSLLNLTSWIQPFSVNMFQINHKKGSMSKWKF